MCNNIYLNRLLNRIYKNGYILMDTIEKVNNDLFKVVLINGLPIKHYNIYKVVVITEEEDYDDYCKINIVANVKYFLVYGYYIYNIKGNIVNIINKQQYMKAIKYAKKCISPMINEFNKVKTIDLNTLPYTLNIK